MRHLTFLQADRPLTKTYYADGKSEPYPLVSNFTSFMVEYQTIEELNQVLQIIAEDGSCVLKGHLTRELKNESRANTTDPSANTDLLVIDYDSDEGFASIEDMLSEIDPLLADTDYVFQHSASSGIKGASGLRGHVFVMLTEPVAPTVLKQWLKKVNLTSERFRKKAKLSRNAMSLCYALDITVNQNDKLIYVAPPKLVDLDDPIAERFELHIRNHRTYAFNSAISVEYNRAKEHALIAELQDKLGIPKRNPKYDVVGGEELLLNPSSCTVTGQKRCGPFMRVNLNGGDSWAYWYPIDNPEILYNYKGEPAVYLKDVAPDYYAQIQRQRQKNNGPLRAFVFRDVTTDTYYNAEYNEETKKLIHCDPVSKQKSMMDFMVQRGCPAPRVIPDWTIKFDPADFKIVDFGEKVLNLYSPTVYMDEQAMASPKLEVGYDSFPTIHKILSHVCVDEPTYKQYLKWIAHIIQFRTKTQTAWLFSGTEGTGKGVMFDKILKPLFGDKYCHHVGQENMEEKYNDHLAHNLILFLDEGDIETSKAAERVMAKLRSTITEQTLAIRAMRQNSYQARNYTNVIVATNRAMAIKLQQGDRRWNIAPRQHTRIVLTDEELEVNIPNELAAFAAHLRALPITTSDARTLVQTEARSDLLDLSRTVADEFFEAFSKGDLDFFAERLQELVPVGDTAYISFSAVVTEWMRSAGSPIVVPIDDLVTVYRYIGGNEGMTAKRFGHAASRHELRSRQVRINGIQRRVFDVKFEDRGYSAWLDRGQKGALVRVIKDAAQQNKAS